MAYQSSRVGVAQMFDDLVAAGAKPYDVAVQLGAALKERSIILWYQDEPVVEEIDHIAQSLKDFVANPKRKPEGWAVARWIVVAQNAHADREQFEMVFGLRKLESATAVPNRRIISDEALVVEAVEGLRSDRWPNIHRASLDLAQRAEGNSLESNARRLRDKIKKAMN